MVLVDTSVVVAWLDGHHSHHAACRKALEDWGGRDELAVSCVTYAELAAGARTKQGVDEQLSAFVQLDLNFESAWLAGQRFRRYRPSRAEIAVLPDFFIRAQASVLNLPHLTDDRGRLSLWPDVDFIFPDVR